MLGEIPTPVLNVFTSLRAIVHKIRRRLAASRAVRRAKIDTQARLAAAPVKRVLVICYGNIYRSAFLGRYLSDALHGVAEVRSAGFHPKTGRPAPDRHVVAAARLGVNLQEHRSALVRKDDLEWADTILLMDRHNWAALEEAGADARKYVWTGALSEGPVEVVDPYQLTDESASAITERLLRCGRGLTDVIRRQQ
jgi:protein-tyrosine-phosphatase